MQLNVVILDCNLRFETLSSSVNLTYNISNLQKLNISYILVHPCDKDDNGGCEQICNKVGKEAECACEANYNLQDDGKKCGT